MKKFLLFVLVLVCFAFSEVVALQETQKNTSGEIRLQNTTSSIQDLTEKKSSNEVDTNNESEKASEKEVQITTIVLLSIFFFLILISLILFGMRI